MNSILPQIFHQVVFLIKMMKSWLKTHIPCVILACPTPKLTIKSEMWQNLCSSVQQGVSRSHRDMSTNLVVTKASLHQHDIVLNLGTNSHNMTATHWVIPTLPITVQYRQIPLRYVISGNYITVGLSGNPNPSPNPVPGSAYHSYAQETSVTSLAKYRSWWKCKLCKYMVL